MMYRVSYHVEREVFSGVRTLRKTAPRRVHEYVNKTLKPDVEKRALSAMQKQPRQSALPFVWSHNPAANARARRWYFANKVPKGRRGKRRYQRTGQMVAGWKVLFDLRGGTLSLRNSARGVEYVQGNRQVPSHKRTRWAVADVVVEKEARRAQDALIKFWQSMTAGKP